MPVSDELLKNPIFYGSVPTDLHKACIQQKVAEVKKYLAEGLDFKAVDSLNQDALIFAVRNQAETEEEAENIFQIATMLIEAGANVNVKDKYGDPVLILCVMDGGGVSKHKTVKALIDAGADVFQQCDNFKKTPLHWAAVCGDVTTAKLLVEAGARKNKICRLRRTPLEEAKHQLKRFEDNLDGLGRQYEGEEKEKLVPAMMKKLRAFIAYMENLPGIKL
eukprot:CAMPEP_0119314456 /NCGR_PEP_ID=MMETSP1333-20130426/32808_1 /TAXON_ID=418940 /ORGANISM="Scyphosphaera apsteinii, Strain RCC1455" /LENGTH=219 /DNA_ID=CAMNT_0007319563 /DNA_START=78 /DNA_END=737 /DNA_ORIENTATION=+